jgi:GNAT superfamily N-acetyltransferase
MHSIRPLSATDSLTELTELLHRAYARLADMGLNYTAVDQSPEVTAQRIEGGQCFVAASGERLVGTVVLKPTYQSSECEYFTRPGVAAVHQFAVEPASQGQGIGKSLLLACERWALLHGYKEVAMDTAEQASHLVSMYQRYGYQQVGRVQWPGKVYRSVVLSKALHSAA